MDIIDKPLIVGGTQLGFFQAYTDIDPEFVPMEPQTRVLPAPFFYERRLNFYLVRRFEPGENKFYPLGGYEVRGEDGGLRCYDLDQVIKHPSLIKRKIVLDRDVVEEVEVREERSTKPQIPSQRRGRPALDPQVRKAREALKMEAGVRSGGRRGRPKSTQVKPESAPKTTGNKRGRPSLSAEEITRREAAKASIIKQTGGMRVDLNERN